MAKGPEGQRRPGDTIGAAIMVAKIATGEIEESQASPKRSGGLKGGKHRAASLTSERRSEIARKAAQARWQTQ